jgi:hypothetical protein
MISEKEKEEILACAYVPEHVVGLMTSVSGGEPYLLEGYFACLAGDVLIVVGYPLDRNFSAAAFEKTLQRFTRKLRPHTVLFIAPEMPALLAASCSERESDSYYTLDLLGDPIPSRLRRIAERAGEHLRVERGNRLDHAHRLLAEEFVERADPPPRVRELLFRMWSYVGLSDASLVLSAWDSQSRLAAFYVMDMSARDFSTYVIGCHSRLDYAKGASDLLFFDMIRVSCEHDKSFIHLGLGVNDGIRRFKKKWGGVPEFPYEMGGFAVKKPSLLDALLGF